jgi:hypothetical protein
MVRLHFAHRYLPEGEDDPSKVNVVELHVWGPAGASVPPGLMVSVDGLRCSLEVF